ncbi:ATP-dependent RecD-like DNA helicase [Marivita cryptomonadis]|uniref:ATP-dependent RecD2 DNA helicase n=1 Tax=Marivita cryptomonadis TaxID=505252 RepID=A0A9Q2PFX4_9RHOB|nr:ATP-dependent RecD-like DNA helicase [Marivita cryptomonadis]MBM2324095.1 ATP-dependent RecD-like DNA helicase [Marivita cryptomonadis]MBM2333688.1 ATP-dependent RecD-like DNA helicase [Marivita cryptomonadis]MBM2343262.1 ATP-dependent RecD-like DNA helicase [Marivita cryptomonadis]MBM2347937.1 ATP-dependent RecD-like DNA helicase [Marivita cryptomonadis]MBM2352618.1 ATP-dependent RecD-like DNA helicase [Marivita cryptomonadis]
MTGTGPDSTTEVLAGLVERVTFHSEESGFCVLRVKARGHRDLVTTVGHAAMISAGEWITASGIWLNDRTHGLQFKAHFLKTSAPSSLDGIEKYLGSGMIKGIGPVYAKRLVRMFGKDVFDIIEASPDRLREVEGIGPKRADKITAGWADQKVIREIMVFLHQNGVGTARAVRIFKTYGTDAVQVMSENPYRLAKDIRGIGFRTADLIAEKLGIEKTAMIRIRAGISFALTEAMGNGHCGLPRAELIGLAEKLLEVPAPLIESALAEELMEETVTADRVGDAECVFLTGLYLAERGIAEQIKRIRSGPLPWHAIDADKALPWIEQKTGLALADSQAEAVRLALRSKIMVITGGPGVGKTTIVNSILRILAAKRVNLLLCAPTGRAAKRMTEATEMEAKTIHRLLEFDPKAFGFKRDLENPLDCDLLVVDESSMVDVMLMQSLLKAVPDHAALLIVGDIDQLPSVGPGQVLADIIGSDAVPVMRLTEVFRQAAESKIITTAHAINAGRMPDLSPPDGDTDFYFVPAADPEQAVARIVELVSKRIPNRFGFDPIRDIQVLCPMNRGGVGARSLNIELQAALNLAGEKKVERFGWTFAPGDKVMQIENDYDKDVYNGDIGMIDDVDLDEGEVAVNFDGRTVSFVFGELDTLVPAYAATIHKSQGSEYPVVVIPVMTQHYAMLQRNLIYTGVTRGKKLVVLVGQARAVAIAVKNISGRRRWSKLDEWLRGERRP